MIWLTVVSILWSFSFGTIRTLLNDIDPTHVAAIRLAIALLGTLGLSFLWRIINPNTNSQKISTHRTIHLQYIGIGALQFGLMYILYIRSYQYLHAAEVALLTITTPIWVYLFSMKNIPDRLRALPPLLLVLLGSFILRFEMQPTNIQVPLERATGILLVTGANICFALGQVIQKKRGTLSLTAHAQNHVFAFLGAVILALLSSILVSQTPISHIALISSKQWLALCYLGLVGSGFGFLMWNYGALQVSHQVLGLMNNLKIPLAVLVSAIFFGELAVLSKWNFWLAVVFFVLALYWERYCNNQDQRMLLD